MKQNGIKLWMLVVLLTLLFCSAGTVVSAYELNEVDWTQTERIYYDNFSLDSTANYEYGNCTATYGEDTQNLTVTMGTTGNFYLELPEISPTKQFVIVTYQVQVSAKNQVLVRPMLYRDDTKYAIGEDTTMTLAAAATSYEIAVVFDRESGSSDIYLAGTKMQSGGGSFPAKNWSFRLLAKGTNANAVRTMTLDDIAVYESDTCFGTEETLGEPYLTVDGQKTNYFTTGAYQVHVDVPAQKETQKFVVIAAEYHNQSMVRAAIKQYEITPEDGESELVLDVAISDSASNTLKCMVWDDFVSMTPLFEDVKQFSRISSDELLVECMYPNFTFKAITFSFDDGNVSASCDPKLLSLMNQYEVKGTFNLYPYRWREYEGSELKELIQLYDGHEVANHSYSHFKTLPYLDEDNVIQAGDTVEDDHVWTEAETLAQIQFGNTVLEDWFGYDMRGFVYPGGYPEEYRNAMKEYMSNNGIVYARPVAVSKNFDLPTDWLGWKNTCKSEDMGQYKASFFALNPDCLQVFAIWGHSQDLNTYETWDIMEEICLKIQQSNGAIWNPTNIELYDYIKATEQLEITDTAVKNNAEQAVYLRINNQKVCLMPNECYEQ